MRKRRKSRKKWILSAMLLIFLLLAVLLLSLRIQTVEISGNERYTDEQIEAMIFDSKLGKNAAYCYYQYKFKPHKVIPFVEDYKIEFKSPLRVKIIVYEKSVVGYVSYMNSLMYFDKDGIIVESTTEKLKSIPLVTGLRFGHIVLHQPLPVDDPDIFNEILTLTQVLAVNKITVDEINFNSKKEARLMIGDLVVELGANKNINEKINTLANILNDYSGFSGTLYLDNYSENDAGSGIVFQPKQK